MLKKVCGQTLTPEQFVGEERAKGRSWQCVYSKSRGKSLKQLKEEWARKWALYVHMSLTSYFA
jgi:hypothetical protein